MARHEIAPPNRRTTRLPADAIQKTVDVLVIERQRMREHAANREQLEANRHAILYWQRELSLARHSGGTD